MFFGAFHPGELLVPSRFLGADWVVMWMDVTVGE